MKKDVRIEKKELHLRKQDIFVLKYSTLHIFSKIVDYLFFRKSTDNSEAHLGGNSLSIAIHLVSESRLIYLFDQTSCLTYQP